MKKKTAENNQRFCFGVLKYNPAPIDIQCFTVVN